MTLRVVIVTGGANGIGRATAVRFAESGTSLHILDRDVQHQAALKEECRATGAEVHVHALDVTDESAVDGCFRNIVETHGRLDVLINNAGIVRDAQLVKQRDGLIVGRMKLEQFQAVLDANLNGVFLCSRAGAGHMIERQCPGVILSASSVVTKHGNFGQTNYVASKSGVVAMTRTWARELGRYGIRVNAVAPGFIATEMLQYIPEKQRSQLAARTPLGRLGEPRDVANAYFWLASNEASFVTGTVLEVDGGAVLGT